VRGNYRAEISTGLNRSGKTTYKSAFGGVVNIALQKTSAFGAGAPAVIYLLLIHQTLPRNGLRHASERTSVDDVPYRSPPRMYDLSARLLTQCSCRQHSRRLNRIGPIKVEVAYNPNEGGGASA
jgi:hypothetical protein